jgi:hypothetical protein
VLALLAVQMVERFDQTPTRPDFDSLFDRVSESAYAVKGRVIESKSIGRRAPKSEDLAKLGTTLPLVRGGRLFAIAVSQTLCRQSDFAAAASQTAPLTGLVYIFVPAGEPITPGKLDPNRRNVSEFLSQGKEYLLFLRNDPRQADLDSMYQLDPGLTYYRTYEGDRGAVQLPDTADQGRPRDFVTPLVSGVTALCDAVKGPDVETKIRNLNAVKAHSADPAWRQSVDAAINALQESRTKPAQK